MDRGSWLVIVVGFVAVLLIFATMPSGRALSRRLGVGPHSGRAPKRDREYLLRACGGDRERVARLLAYERRHDPEMSEARAYRRAIRSVLRDKR